MTNIMPIQKAGNDARIMASVVPMASKMLYCFTAARIPRATPTTMPMTVAPAASVTVTGNRASTDSRTLFPVTQLVPRSPWNSWTIYIT